MALMDQKTKNKSLDTIQSVFLTKCALNFVGFVLKAAIVCTLLNKPMKNDTDPGQSGEFDLKRFGFALLAYIILVAIVVVARVVIQKQTQSLTMSKEHADTLKALLGGLNLIPAWGFKDCVAVVIAGTAWWTAFIVLIFATVVAVLMEPPPPEAGELPTIIDNTRQTLAGCMALGVGFAMHTVPVTIWRSMGHSFFTIPVTASYALILTTIVVFVQISLKKIKTEPDQVYYRSFLNFSGSAGNFMSAWSWDAFLEALRRLLIASAKASCLATFGINMGWAFAVLIVGAISVVGFQINAEQGEHTNEMEAGIAILIKTIAACCVAWAFMDVFIGVYKCLDFNGYLILGAWICAMVVLVLAVGIMAAGNRLIENAKKAEV